ncbi:MAG: RdgB/HAM1 family non-canonical purine NTP pyrophosphatase [Salibacteraceae bacterium]
MNLIFATNNEHKLQELKQAVPHLSLKGLKEAGIFEDIPETGSTLKANALIKARFLYDKLGVDCFADDTGLEVESLEGRPGVFSARYAGEQASFSDNNEKLLKELKNKANRKAQFKTVICLILTGKEYYFEGICKGEILKDYSGTDGFGYDPIFQPVGFNQSFAQMSMDQKNAISHRGLAVKKLIEFLKR